MSDVVIVFLSTQSINREGYIQKGLKYALDVALEKPWGTIFIIPLRLENCIVPDRLSDWQWVNYFPFEERNLSYNRLLLSLQRRIATLEAHSVANTNFDSDVAISLSAHPISQKTAKNKTLQIVIGSVVLILVCCCLTLLWVDADPSGTRWCFFPLKIISQAIGGWCP